MKKDMEWKIEPVKDNDNRTQKEPSSWRILEYSIVAEELEGCLSTDLKAWVQMRADGAMLGTVGIYIYRYYIYIIYIYQVPKPDQYQMLLVEVEEGRGE